MVSANALSKSWNKYIFCSILSHTFMPFSILSFVIGFDFSSTFKKTLVFQNNLQLLFCHVIPWLVCQSHCLKNADAPIYRNFNMISLNFFYVKSFKISNWFNWNLIYFHFWRVYISQIKLSLLKAWNDIFVEMSKKKRILCFHTLSILTSHSLLLNLQSRGKNLQPTKTLWFSFDFPFVWL